MSIFLLHERGMGQYALSNWVYVAKYNINNESPPVRLPTSLSGRKISYAHPRNSRVGSVCPTIIIKIVVQL